MINFNKYLEEVNEGKIVLKRKYTENHPEKNVRQGAAIRNSIIEALRDKKLTLSEFNEIVAKHSKSPNKWTQRNKRFFKIEEDNVSLSGYGSKIAKTIQTVNEGRKEITKKQWDKADDDQREEWLLGAFSDPDDAIEHIEKDWEDLPSVATSNMYESVVNEAKLKFKVGDFIKMKKGGALSYEIKSVDKKFDAVEVFNDVTGKSTKYKIKHINKDWKLAESVVTEAVNEAKKLDIGDKGVDYNDNVVEIITIGNYSKIAKMFKKETGDDPEDYGFEKGPGNFYLTKNIESEEGNVGDMGIYPVKYDMGNYWGLDPLKEAKVIEGKTHADYGLSAKFDYALADLSDKKFNTKDITALAKKYKQDPESAIEYAKTAFKWLWKESVQNEEVNESVINEAIKIEDKRTARKVMTQYNRIFTKQLPALADNGLNATLAYVKHICLSAMEDANFHRERESVGKTIKGARFENVEVKAPGLGNISIVVGANKLKKILDEYFSQISNAAGWSGQGIVEGTALYLSTYHKQDVIGQAMIDAFNSQFEGENVRVNIEDKLNENKSNEMIHTNFSDFVNEAYEEINEKLKSSKLRGLLTMKKGGKEILKSIYGAYKIDLANIEDHQINDIDPKDGKKQTGVVVYYTTQIKENPYADGEKSYDAGIAANTILGIGKGSKIMYATRSYRGKTPIFGLSADGKNSRWSRTSKSDIGINKEYSGWGASGIYTVKRMIELADAAFVINPEALPNTEEKIAGRKDAQSGAAALKDPKEFKDANMLRYKNILATRANTLDIDKMVSDAVDEISKIMSDGIKAKKKNKYNEFIMGTGKDGRDFKIRDLTNYMTSLLDDYERWSGHKETQEKSDGDEWEYRHAEKEAKQYAHSIKDRLAKMKTKNFGW